MRKSRVRITLTMRVTANNSADLAVKLARLAKAAA